MARWGPGIAEALPGRLCLAPPLPHATCLRPGWACLLHSMSWQVKYLFYTSPSWLAKMNRYAFGIGIIVKRRFFSFNLFLSNNFYSRVSLFPFNFKDDNNSHQYIFNVDFCGAQKFPWKPYFVLFDDTNSVSVKSRLLATNNIYIKHSPLILLLLKQRSVTSVYWLNHTINLTKQHSGESWFLWRRKATSTPPPAWTHVNTVLHRLPPRRGSQP